MWNIFSSNIELNVVFQDLEVLVIEEVAQDYSTTDAADVTEAATESSEAAEVTTGAAEIRDLDAFGTFLISLIMIIIIIIIIKMRLTMAIMMMIIIII